MPIVQNQWITTKTSADAIEGAKSDRPFANCSMDLITDLPESDGCDSILSMVDHGLTKGVIFIPTVKTATHEDIAQLLVNNLFPRFGIPDSMISDRDPRFTAKEPSKNS